MKKPYETPRIETESFALEVLKAGTCSCTTSTFNKAAKNLSLSKCIPYSCSCYTANRS